MNREERPLLEPSWRTGRKTRYFDPAGSTSQRRLEKSPQLQITSGFHPDYNRSRKSTHKAHVFPGFHSDMKSFLSPTVLFCEATQVYTWSTGRFRLGQLLSGRETRDKAMFYLGKTNGLKGGRKNIVVTSEYDGSSDRREGGGTRVSSRTTQEGEG